MSTAAKKKQNLKPCLTSTAPQMQSHQSYNPFSALTQRRAITYTHASPGEGCAREVKSDPSIDRLLREELGTWDLHRSEGQEAEARETAKETEEPWSLTAHSVSPTWLFWRHIQHSALTHSKTICSDAKTSSIIHHWGLNWSFICLFPGSVVDHPEKRETLYEKLIAIFSLSESQAYIILCLMCNTEKLIYSIQECNLTYKCLFQIKNSFHI